MFCISSYILCIFYRILATQTINIFYLTYILLYYQNTKCIFTIILLLVKINRDNCITAFVLSCNCTSALIFLTLHVCPWFSKLKAPFAPVCQHRELDLNNCSKKIHKKEKKGKRLYYPLSQTHYSPRRAARLRASPRPPAAAPVSARLRRTGPSRRARSLPASAAPFATTSTTPLGEPEATATPPRH